MSVNKVILVGNVGRDPEVRYLEGGQQGQTKVATFTLATSERYRDRNGELKENTEWHNIVAWRQSADVCERFVKRGTQLYIEGKLRTRSFTDAQGAKRYTTEINVDTLQLLGRRDETGAPQQGYQGGYQGAQPAQQPAAPRQYNPAPAAPAPAPAQQYQAPAVPQQAPAAAPAPIDIAMDDPSDDLPF